MDLLPGTLAAFGLILVRCSALILTAPLLGSHAGFSGVRVALVAAISLLMYSAVGEPLPEPLGPLAWGLLALSEVLIGIALSFVLELSLLAARVAGDMLGHEMGFSMAQIADPITGQNGGLMTSLHETLFLIGLLMVDGHHWMLRALGDSFRAAPVGRLSGALADPGPLSNLVLDQFTSMFAAGITLAAPVLVLLFLVSTLIGLLAKAVPQLNLLEAGFTLRILTGLTASLLFAPMLAPAMSQIYDSLFDGLADTVSLMEAR